LTWRAGSSSCSMLQAVRCRTECLNCLPLGSEFPSTRTGSG
jgi:hypothetical protein